jgi:hypothetical protein
MASVIPPVTLLEAAWAARVIVAAAVKVVQSLKPPAVSSGQQAVLMALAVAAAQTLTKLPALPAVTARLAQL